MVDPNTIKKAFERIRMLVKEKPGIGKKTVSTNVRLKEGTTCEVVHKDWTFKVDIGEAEGGNNAGPGPGLLQRGALGGCLAIGYVQQAAVMGIPIDHIEIEIEVDKDLSGRLGLSDHPSGSKSLRYNVLIESPASEVKIQNVVEKADRLSPVLDDFRRAVPVERKLKIRKVKQNEIGEAEQ
jgi:uncharacterized OsmC-like protein